MKLFRIDDHRVIVCEWKKTRSAFKHVATLLIDGQEQAETKICYQNRTWENFEFESVIEQLLDKTGILTEEERAKFLSEASGRSKAETDGELGLIGRIAKMGDILCNDKVEKNDWKTRMIKAGLENKGLIMPEDWDQLSETDKEKRLNGVIGVLTS